MKALEDGIPHAPEPLTLRRGGVRALLLGGLLFLSSGCGPRWMELQQPDSGMVVSLPGPATCGSVREKSSRGLLEGRFCTASLPSSRNYVTGIFSVEWIALPAGLDETGVTELSRELVQQEIPVGTELRARPATLDGSPGVEYEAIYSQSGDAPGSRRWEWVLRRRFAARQGRLYWVRAWGTRGERTDATWNRMLESFKFVPAEASR